MANIETGAQVTGSFSRFVMTSKHCKPMVPTMFVCIIEMTLAIFIALCLLTAGGKLIFNCFHNIPFIIHVFFKFFLWATQWQGPNYLIEKTRSGKVLVGNNQITKEIFWLYLTVIPLLMLAQRQIRSWKKERVLVPSKFCCSKLQIVGHMWGQLLLLHVVDCE